MSGDRGTGHFGTGTYFVGDKAQLSGSYAQRPMETVDFSKYNLFRPKNQADGLAVHEFLKGVNSYYDSLNDRIQSEEELDSRIEDFETAVENFNDSEEALSDIDWDGVLHFDRIVGIAEDILGEYEVGQILMHNVPSGTDIWGGTVNEMQDGDGNLYGALNLSKMVENPNRFIYDLEKAMDSWRLRSAVRKFEDFRNSTGKIAKMLGTTEAKLTDAINGIAGEIDAAGYDLRSMYTADSASTRLMKALGYEGVDVRGIEGLDNTMYGSVIYDLKDEDLARKQEIGTAKFSLSKTDSNGVVLSDAQQEFFKDSKVRDAEGNLLEMYHGTSSYGFTTSMRMARVNTGSSVSVTTLPPTSLSQSPTRKRVRETTRASTACTSTSRTPLIWMPMLT